MFKTSCDVVFSKKNKEIKNSRLANYEAKLSIADRTR